MIGIASIKAELRWADSLQDEQSRHNAKLSIFKDALVTWLRANNPPTLGQLLIANKLKPASVFTHFSNYFCRVSNFPPALQKHRTKPAAEAYSKLDDIKPGWRIVCRFHHEHLTSNSSWSELSGQKRLLVLGVVTEITKHVIEAVPFVIANPMPDFNQATRVGSQWPRRLEIFIDMIDSLKRVKKIKPSKAIRDLVRADSAHIEA